MVKRRAKIVCTLGPATSTYEGIRGLVYAGMDVARLNFSHGADAQHEQAYRWGRCRGGAGAAPPGRNASPGASARHEQAYRWVRQASDESGRGVGVLVDLQGPKIRLGTFAAGPGGWGAGASRQLTH